MNYSDEALVEWALYCPCLHCNYHNHRNWPGKDGMICLTNYLREIILSRSIFKGFSYVKNSNFCVSLVQTEISENSCRGVVSFFSSSFFLLLPLISRICVIIHKFSATTSSSSSFFFNIWMSKLKPLYHKSKVKTKQEIPP